MKKQDYSTADTARFKAERNAKTKAFKKQMKSSGTPIEIKYPEGCTQQQRGFTQSSGVIGYFKGIAVTINNEQRLGLNKTSRKPTKGTKHYFQVVTTRQNEKGETERLSTPLIIPPAYNKAGQLIRAGFTYNKPITKRIQHQITPRKVGSC